MNYDLVLTEEFKNWLAAAPITIRRRIKARLDHAVIGHFGLHKRFDGLIELKWQNGIRIYFFIWESTVIIVLNGGNKNGQSYDIKKAKKIQTDILNGVRTVLKPGT